MVKATLRSRAISGGRLSLYLDFWPPAPLQNGRETRRENLKLYIFKRARTEIERIHNKNTQDLAETIRAIRQMEVQSQAYGIGCDGDDILVKDYIEGLIRKRKASSRQPWRSMLRHFEMQKASSLKLSLLEASHCLRFRSALVDLVDRGSLKSRTAHNYLSYFGAAIRTAYKAGLIKTNIMDRVASIKPSESRREYLLLDELNKLIDTKCKSETVRSISIFAALTGMRISDIKALTWESIVDKDNGEASIEYVMIKTSRRHVLPIGKQARGLIGKRGTGNVWPYIPAPPFLNVILRRWTAAAGITKHITMHCFRHTYATLQLGAGTDLKTLCDLLGQSDIKTTLDICQSAG